MGFECDMNRRTRKVYIRCN